MVVASTLAFLAVNDKLSGLTKGQLVEMSMENETRVGVCYVHSRMAQSNLQYTAIRCEQRRVSPCI